MKYGSRALNYSKHHTPEKLSHTKHHTPDKSEINSLCDQRGSKTSSIYDAPEKNFDSDGMTTPFLTILAYCERGSSGFD